MNQSGDIRIRRLLIITSWASLITGILTGIIASEGSLVGLAAALVAAIWVTAVSMIPLQVVSRPLVIDAVGMGGSLLVVTSMTLSGGTLSPYLILSFLPTMMASLWSGLRAGLATAGLTAALLLAVSLSQQTSMTQSIAIGSIHLVVATTVAQVRRVLHDTQVRATSLEASAAETNRRLEDLETANRLLARLAELTASSESSPIELGQTALNTLADLFPESSFTVAIDGANGPIVVARTGSSGRQMTEQRIDLEVGGRTVGYVRIASPQPLGHDELDRASVALEPLALAFSNVLLLQDLTTSAVKQERKRLARELHDEIGPSLSSLGLSLDVAMLQGYEQRELNEHLQRLRNQVSMMVDEVRTTVSDLRAPRAGSLRSFLGDLSIRLDRPFSFEELDERRPIRPSLSEPIYAICAEAIRNAVLHGEATTIAVKGWVNFDRGQISIVDNGTGFDPRSLPPGHFGVVGMQERARDAGLQFDIQSGFGGTRVRVGWGTE